ncbi:MAG: hypothetical protein ABFS09_09545 [Thermodesulfobacteriota bacterium]
MKRQELIETNPLRLISPSDGGMVAGRHLALVKSSAGVGKTAILVQIALDKLLRGEHVVHIGINEQLNNIKLWYSHAFGAQARQVELAEPDKVEGETMDRRLLMTFMAENFSPARLAERLDGLSRHGISLPDCVVIDGLAAQGTESAAIFAELRAYAQERNITLWLSCLDLASKVKEQADTVLELQDSSGGTISLSVVKDDAGYAEEGAAMRLDPQTLTLFRC